MISNPTSISDELKKVIDEYANFIEPVCKGTVTAIYTTTVDVYLSQQRNVADDIIADTGMTLRDVPVIVPITDLIGSLNISKGDTVYICFVGGDVNGAHVIGRLWTGVGD